MFGQTVPNVHAVIAPTLVWEVVIHVHGHGRNDGRGTVGAGTDLAWGYAYSRRLTSPGGGFLREHADNGAAGPDLDGRTWRSAWPYVCPAVVADRGHLLRTHGGSHRFQLQSDHRGSQCYPPAGLVVLLPQHVRDDSAGVSVPGAPAAKPRHQLCPLCVLHRDLRSLRQHRAGARSVRGRAEVGLWPDTRPLLLAVADGGHHRRTDGLRLLSRSPSRRCFPVR